MNKYHYVEDVRFEGKVLSNSHYGRSRLKAELQTP